MLVNFKAITCNVIRSNTVTHESSTEILLYLKMDCETLLNFSPLNFDNSIFYLINQIDDTNFNFPMFLSEILSLEIEFP